MSGLVARARKALREKGVGHVMRSGADIVSHKVSLNSQYVYHKLTRSHSRFVFQGTEHRYFIHRHNTTWKNERCVEIPVVWKMLQENQGKAVLEVGNVLSHYYPVAHEIVDKYEASQGVINQDIVDYHPSRKYDLIVSISTMEHVGWDEDPREKSKILGEPVKILQALENLQNCLAPGGTMVITYPVGYNPQLDRSMIEGRIGFTKRFCMKRVSRNKWEECDWSACAGASYGSPYPSANALVILVISKR